MVVQIGQGSALAWAAPGASSRATNGFCHSDPLNAQNATPATSAPNSAANAIERIILRGSLAVDASDLYTCASTISFLCQERLRLLDLMAFGIGILRQLHKLCEIVRCLLPVAGRIRGARCTPEPAIAVGVCLQRRLVFGERSNWLPHFEQQFTQELAHRVKPVLHRYMLDATVFAVSGSTHKLHRLVPRTFAQRHPARHGKNLL